MGKYTCSKICLTPAYSSKDMKGLTELISIGRTKKTWWFPNLGEGDVWFNAQKTTLHIERRGKRPPRYFCGLIIEPKHTRYRGFSIGTTKARTFDIGTVPFCRRCVKIKMQWAWKR